MHKQTEITAALVHQQCLLSLPVRDIPIFEGDPFQIKSNQFYLHSPKLQSHCHNGLYNLYSERHPLSLDSQLEWGKTCHVDGKKDHFNRVKKNKKTMEETSGRATEEGSPFQDGQIYRNIDMRTSLGTITLSWWRGLHVSMNMGARLSGAMHSWQDLPKQIGLRWGASLSKVQKYPMRDRDVRWETLPGGSPGPTSGTRPGRRARERVPDSPAWGSSGGLHGATGRLQCAHWQWGRYLEWSSIIRLMC